MGTGKFYIKKIYSHRLFIKTKMHDKFIMIFGKIMQETPLKHHTVLKVMDGI